jgi:ketosteroid isomerase-like protein
VDEEKQSQGTPGSSANSPETNLEGNPEVEDFFHRLMERQDMKRPKPSPEAIAAALQAMQRLGAAVGNGADDPASSIDPDPMTEAGSGCPSCGYHNQGSNRFCGMCGAPMSAPTEEAPSRAQFPPGSANGQHHYHHHYHHHYFAQGQQAEFLAGGLGQHSPVAGSPVKETVRTRAPLGGPSLSRAEASLRQMTQDWALACNNKQLDDLLTFYGTDSLVLRPNLPPVRGMAAIREFFFSALDSGLGDIEMEALRVELLGDVAYEAGRCKMLVPVAVGKRREERGKYVVVFAKQNGEWKAVVDSWSSDLSLNVSPETAVKPAAMAAVPPKPRR